MTSLDTGAEQILVVPTALFHRCGYFQGFNTDVDRYFSVLLDANNTSYRPRSEMEFDPSYKQLIPYCIFRFVDANGGLQLFQYTRGKNQGETRLYSKRSIGIGGHVSTLDAGDHSPYLMGMHRELDEEVRIETDYSQSCVGLINDDETEVGKVHLGIVHLFDVVRPTVFAKESDIADAGFRPAAELLDSIDQFESWSQVCLRALFMNSAS
jgi:predicted NUDIX family phosphoesterase